MTNKKYCPIANKMCEMELCELWVSEEQKCSFTLLAINSNNLKNLNCLFSVGDASDIGTVFDEYFYGGN